MDQPLKILAIETSCDETAISKVLATGSIDDPRFEVLTNAISSQIDIHRPFGGVVPNLAKREHIRNLPILLKKIDQTASSKSKLFFEAKDADLIAVTVGPGLEPALWTGINFAKSLSEKWQKPIIGVNHLHGHLYSFLLTKNYELKTENLFPSIALIVSGGHTLLLKMESMTKWEKIGETVDDAVGEAYDKVARILSLPYPGGPEIEKLALQGDPDAIDFPRPMLNQKNYDFSFAGLKTAVLYHLRDNPETIKEDVAASFQKAAIDVLVKKTMRAVEEFGANSVILAGGVAANNFLRSELREKSAEISVQFFSPELEYNTDNATMIAAAGYINWLKITNKKGKVESEGNLIIGDLPLEANGNLGI